MEALERYYQLLQVNQFYFIQKHVMVVKNERVLEVRCVSNYHLPLDLSLHSLNYIFKYSMNHILANH
jgi:hypothetical protein